MNCSQLFLKHLELTKEYKDPLLILNEPIYNLLYDNVRQINTLEKFIYAYYLQSEEKYSGHRYNSVVSRYFFEFDLNCIFQLFKVVHTNGIMYVYKLFLTPLLTKFDLSPLALNIFKCVYDTTETDFVMPYLSHDCSFSSNSFRIQNVQFENNNVIVHNTTYKIKSIESFKENVDWVSILCSIRQSLTNIHQLQGIKIYHYQCPLIINKYCNKEHEEETIKKAIKLLWPPLKRPVLKDIIHLKHQTVYFPKLLVLIIIFLCIFCITFILVYQIT